MGFEHTRIEQLESTNDYLWEYASQNQLADFFTVSTAFQSKGKGQSESIWESEKDQNILMSTLVNPHALLAENAFQISRWASVAIVSYLDNKGIDNISIKWPNDIYIDSRKIAGILIQNSISGQMLSKSMVGIGLNVNQSTFNNSIPNPISLIQQTLTNFNITDEIDLLIKEMQTHYMWVINNPQLLIDTYHQLLFQKEEWYNYESKGVQFKGKIKGVNQFGQLIVEKMQGNNRIFDIKDILFLH